MKYIYYVFCAMVGLMIIFWGSLFRPADSLIAFIVSLLPIVLYRKQPIISAIIFILGIVLAFRLFGYAISVGLSELS